MKEFVWAMCVLTVFISSACLSAQVDKQDPVYARVIIYVADRSLAAKTLNEQKPDYIESLVDEFPELVETVNVRTAVTTDLTESYPPPDVEYLAYFGEGITKQQAAEVQTATAAIIVEAVYPHDMIDEAQKRLSRYALELAEHANGLIWDSETRQLFSPPAWQKKRLQAWQGKVPVIESQIVIHVYKNNEYVRAITLGMAKFGLPDLVVNDFSWSLNRQMSMLITSLSQALVEGAIWGRDGRITIDLHQLADTPFKQDTMASLREGADGRFTVQLSKAMAEEGDPDNFLLQIEFENEGKQSMHEAQEKVLSDLFGWENKLSLVNHTEQIERASERAKQKLPALKKAFNSGLNPGEFILLKAPFVTSSGGTEWMWVEVMSWQSQDITGLLKNEPYDVPGLRAGTEVNIRQSDVFDFLQTFPDGATKGNETGELIKKYQTN